MAVAREAAHSSISRAIAEGRSAWARTAVVAAARVRTSGRPSSASARSQRTSAGRAEGWPVHSSRSRTRAARSSRKAATHCRTGPHSVASSAWRRSARASWSRLPMWVPKTGTSAGACGRWVRSSSA
ncbi:hypothetical protein NQP46_13010 [Streptomyces albus]|nr:hypothetical protein NQP46_13010 [Streptomyces albus]